MNTKNFLPTKQRQQIEALETLGWGLCRGYDEDEDDFNYLSSQSGWKFYSEQGALYAIFKNPLNGTIITIGIDTYTPKLDPKKILSQSKRILKDLEVKTVKHQQLSLI